MNDIKETIKKILNLFNEDDVAKMELYYVYNLDSDKDEKILVMIHLMFGLYSTMTMKGTLKVPVTNAMMDFFVEMLNEIFDVNIDLERALEITRKKISIEELTLFKKKLDKNQ